MSSGADLVNSFGVIESMDFGKGFVYSAFYWRLETLCKRSRTNEFSINGCSGAKWTLALVKREIDQTTIGLYCKDSMVCVPAVFRIALYDSQDNLLMNRACYFNFGGSNGCGFAIGNWTMIERQLRIQNRPLTAYLMINVPKDGKFPTVASYPSKPVFPPTIDDLLRTLRSKFEKIGLENGGPSFSDVSILVSVKPREGSADSELVEKNAQETDTVEIRCHRLVLCSRSPVFDRMLSTSDFLESNRGLVNVSEDIDRKTMVEVLRYMYCGEMGEQYQQFKVDINDVVRLLNAAEKYEMVGLKSWCQSCMIVGYDTDEQRHRQLPVAEMFGLEKLKAVCVAQLSSNPVPIDDSVLAQWGANENVTNEIKNEWKEKNGMLCVEVN